MVYLATRQISKPILQNFPGLFKAVSHLCYPSQESSYFPSNQNNTIDILDNKYLAITKS